MGWVLYIRQGCGLCDEMRQELDAFLNHNISADIQYRLVDIDQDQRLRERYNEDVPVLAHDDTVVLKYFFDESLLKKVLNI
jgi:glutaredoxin